ncbi:hypothetical protein VNI00_005625 [Paramarasmius palmivorus]|uniref:NAD-dependent epimerase/dehydratase domain-containing protein n=1 Tax=Paramarasmius palmivorus TaxID=297713 RepID=A0AAW0DDB6_9AGAR
MSQIVFVTGASGHIGSNVVNQLLEQGFRVRATARGEKAKTLRKSFPSFSDRLEVIEIADISKDQVGDALKDVWAIIHLAYYKPKPDEKPEEMIDGTINGSLNILKQGEAAGVKNFVVTGTVAAVSNPKGTLNHDDWNPITKEAAISSGNILQIYSAAKTLSELALWEWAEAHPHVEVTIISPPPVWGPWPKELVLPTPTFDAMTPVFWNLIKPDGKFFTAIPIYADVRDIAQGHIRALTHPVPTSKVGRKRIVLMSPYAYNWVKAMQLLKEKRPALKDLLIKETPPDQDMVAPPGDYHRTEEILGIKKEDFHTFEQTLLDSIDNYVELREQWIKQGHEVNIPPLPF